MTLLLTVIVLSIERWIAISSASGKGNTAKFVADIKADLAANKIDAAMDRCRKQKGSVASVVYNTLVRYKEMDANNELSKEQKHSAPQRGRRGNRSRNARSVAEPPHPRDPHHSPVLWSDFSEL